MAPALLIIAGLTGCASATTTTPVRAAASSSAPAYCASAEKLKDSIKALGSVDVVHGGLSAVQSAVTTISKNLDDFQAAARSDFGPDVTALRTSLGNLQTALSSVVGGKADASTLITVVGDISSVVNNYNTLQKAVSARCG